MIENSSNPNVFESDVNYESLSDPYKFQNEAKLVSQELEKILKKNRQIDDFNVMRLSMDIVSFMVPLLAPAVQPLELMLLELAKVAVSTILDQEEVKNDLRANGHRDSIEDDLLKILEGVRCVCGGGKKPPKKPKKHREVKLPDDWGWKGKCTCASWKRRQKEYSEQLAKEEEGSDHPSDEIESFSSDVQDIQILQQFLQIRPYAEMFVDKICEDAENSVEKVRQSLEGYLNEKIKVSQQFSDTMTPGPLLTIKNFTPRLGWALVDQVVSYWNLEREWSYCIDYIKQESDTTSDYHIYEVKWSLPTPKYPIPQATVSVFFKIEVPRIIPKQCYCNVTYVFESNSTVYDLKSIVNQEAFLQDILDCKLALFQQVKF